MGGDPEVSAVNRVTVDTITGSVYQAGTINLTGADDPEVTAESMEAACAAYARRVRETYGRLDLEVLTPLSEQGEHPVVELREVFVTPQVREDPPPVELPRELVQRLMASEEFTEDALPNNLGPAALERLRAEYLSRPTRDVLSVLAGAHGARLVLLGDPGSGKSTLARYLALTLSQSPDGPLAPLDGLVPLVVELRQYADSQWRERTFEDFLDHRHGVAGMSLPRPELRRLLAEGRAVVVFDGLDELFDSGVRAATAERIAAFAARYERTRVVVTSRVIGYQRAALGGAGFTHFMLQDLAPGRIAEFARRWYAIACPHEPELAARLVERITGAVDFSRPIRELAGNPLLLTILAIIGRRQTLPRDRQGVYEHAVRVLVAHWDRDTKHLQAPLSPTAAEALDLLDDRERLELLRLLARRMQEGTGGIAGNHIHAKDLEAVFREYFAEFGLPPHQCLAAARALRDQLRERNFILARYGGEVYGFVHRAFLEYLAAADIVHRYTVGREWTPEGLIAELFARRADDPAWHEVLLLVVNQLSEPDAGSVIDHLLGRGDDEGLVLAIQSLAEVRKIGLLNSQSDRAIDALIVALAGFADLHRLDPLLAAMSALGSVPVWTGRERYLRWFHLQGQFIALPADAASVAVALHTRVDVSLALAAFGFWRVRDSAVSAMADRWVHRSDGAHSVVQLAPHHPGDTAWSSALSALMERWPSERSARSVLWNRRKRRAAAAVAPDGPAAWVHLPDDLAQLLDLAVHSRAAVIRSDALTKLKKSWHSRPEVLALHLDRAVDDLVTVVRNTAIRALVQRWSTDPGVLALLRDRAAHDPSESTRGLALRELAALDGDSRETVDLLTSAATDLESVLVRRTALEILVARRGSHHETLRLLLDRVVEDAVPEIRGVMLSHYAVLAPETAEAVVRSRAADDLSPKVRSRALTMLTWQWPGRPDTAVILRAALAGDPDSEVRATAESGLRAIEYLASLS
ncbi:NACHT domain-containing protein [Kitasatospora xanthocidica]|uniref:NACHT domain-containing protein n=1 Tax=Kitasatospora xanthocidica TaxID=83382 RepID=UPI0036E3E46B